MGAPRKHRKNYISHKQRWNKQSIEEESVLVEDYGLKNKKEIRRVELMLKKFKMLAKVYNKDENTKKSQEAVHFLESLKAKGFLSQEAQSLDEVLDMSLRDILDRRLSTVLYKNKLARTCKQARQFITHRHVSVDGKVIDSPTYFITLSQEEAIVFRDTSSLNSEEHPERRLAAGNVVEEPAEEETQEEEKTEAVEEKAEEKKEEVKE